VVPLPPPFVCAMCDNMIFFQSDVFQTIIIVLGFYILFFYKRNERGD